MSTVKATYLSDQVGNTVTMDEIVKGGLGIRQTWGKYPDRLANTTYTNTTGKPIVLSIRGTGSAGGSIMEILVDDDAKTYTLLPASGVASSSVIVPSGSTYKLSLSSGSINGWRELR